MKRAAYRPAISTTVSLPLDRPIWDRFFAVAPLVLVGTKEDERYDLAPKHMAMPLGWDDYYAFVCTPRHATYRNVSRYGEFTVSFPRAAQIVEVSLAASGRYENAKPALAALPTFPAHVVDGVLVEGCALWLECALDRIVEGFGDAGLVVGRVVAASAPEETLRSEETDDADLIHRNGLLAYLAPGRFADVRDSRSLPYPSDFAL